MGRAEAAVAEQAALAAEAQWEADGLRQQLEVAAARSAAQLAAAQEGSATELETVQARFLALLQRKDATIGGLQAQLSQLDALCS